ncbi:MAG: hypothetical protein RLZZ314_960 [Bacteroidota bacterium]
MGNAETVEIVDVATEEKEATVLVVTEVQDLNEEEMMVKTCEGHNL